MNILSSESTCSLHLLQGCLHGNLRLLQQAPAIFLHGCLGVKRRLLKLPFRVVLLVHKLVASVIAAIHGLALQASSMLLFDHAATDILLLSLPVCLRGHCLLLVLFCAVILDISFPILLALPVVRAFLARGGIEDGTLPILFLAHTDLFPEVVQLEDLLCHHLLARIPEVVRALLVTEGLVFGAPGAWILDDLERRSACHESEEECCLHCLRCSEID